jgi:CRP-like cAMP-binding protein
VYIVLSGLVAVSRRKADGGTLELGTRGVGELLGELGALDAHTRSATVTAAERTEVAALVASDFLTFISAHPHLAVRMIQSLARRLRQCEARSAGFAPVDMNEVLRS